MNTEQVYVKLLDLLARVVEANKGPLNGADDRLLGAEELASKFFLHAASILYLSHGTKLELSAFPSAQLRFLDPGSVNVLARAVLEAFLTFHYVFIQPKTLDEQNYRYWAWKAAGLTRRQNSPASVEEHRQKLAEDKKQLDELHSKLKSNAAFQQLSSNQQNRVLKKGEWRWLPGDQKEIPWPKIAESAGLAKDLSTNRYIYSYLCEYAHSGSLSTLQITQAGLNKEQLFLIQFTMDYIPIVIANFIREYCDLLPRAKAALTADTEGSEMVDMRIQIGRQLSFGDKSS